MNNKLINHLKELLIKNNYLDLYTFLDVILYDKQFGFYNSINFKKNELIGKKGHFITAPEISQLFGELVGIWILQLCRENHFHNINLLELGPGKGTLMKDILRIFSQQKENIKIKIHLLEFSKVLKSYQKENLKQYGHELKWYNNIFKIKDQLNDKPTIIISNEFFDCLPINQYKFYKTKNIYTKKIVRLDKNNFFFDEQVLEPQDIPFISNIIKKDFDKLNEETTIEHSPFVLSHINQICDIILENKGANLLIDYGKNDPYGDTLQSVFKNERSNLFNKIGESDYSSLVDFSNIEQIVENKNLQYYQLKTQREFLLEMGINKRIENLSLNANEFERRDLLSGYERLVSKRQMGDIFKVICFSDKNLVVPIFNCKKNK